MFIYICFLSFWTEKIYKLKLLHEPLDVVILGFYLSILEDDIFRTLERNESNQPYYITFIISDFAHFSLILEISPFE